MVLLLGSLFFYAWGEPVYVLLMLFSTLSDYLHGLAIGACRRKGTARIFLVSSLLINLGVLGFFKYTNFLIGTVNALGGWSVPLLDLHLPIGISFYTFQTMSYTIDCYRGEARVQRNLLDFAVYVTMFPQLIAGPIVKYRDVQDQLRVRKPDILEIAQGCRRFVAGLAKKVLLANQFGLLWESVKETPSGDLTVLGAWLGIAAFALQIYFDFSGYSDMAIGLGRILGFRFPENFRYPYVSRSVTEFWRRWHISLGSWFREYEYIPLGGNRRGLPRQIFNILLVWMLTGIWHGAGWNFLIWGLWFALWLILEKVFLGKLLERLPAVFGRVYTLAAVLVSWVFFSLEGTGRILGYLGAMFGAGSAGLAGREAVFALRENFLLLAVGAVAATPLAGSLARRMEGAGSGWGIALCRVLEKLILAGLLLASVVYIVEASYNPFLYFRF